MGLDYGYKGYGLTFVCFSSIKFILSSICDGVESQVEVNGAFNWVGVEGGDIPNLNWRMADIATEEECGTTVTVELAIGEYRDRFQALSDLDGFFYWASRPKPLEYVLRTRTAAGNVKPIFGREAMVPINILARIDGEDYNIPYSYLHPRHAKSLSARYVDDIEAYASLFADGRLSTGAKNYLALEEIFLDQIVGTNTIFKTDISIVVCGRRGLTRLAEEYEVLGDLDYLKLTTGVHLSLDGMPSGINMDDWGNRGSFEQRFFVLIDAERRVSGQLDSGRKGVSTYFGGLMVQKSLQLINERRYNSGKDSIRKFAQLMLQPDTHTQLRSNLPAQHVNNARSRPQVDLTSVVTVPEPKDEQEVIAMFFYLIGLDFLKGFHLIYLSQYVVYDAAFEYRIALDDSVIYPQDPNGLGYVAGEMKSQGEAEYVWFDSRGRDWLQAEFKPVVEDLLASRAQSVEDLDLLIVWNFGETVESKYQAIMEKVRPHEREIYGVTHRLIYDGESCDVIVLSHLLTFNNEQMSPS
jgi:hypothetical protein